MTKEIIVEITKYAIFIAPLLNHPILLKIRPTTEYVITKVKIFTIISLTIETELSLNCKVKSHTNILHITL